jgi:hypothetical protein
MRFLPAVAYQPNSDRLILAMGRVGPSTRIKENDVWVLTEPLPSVVQGQTFTYPIAASDPDPGATLTYSLDEAPAGMTVDAVTGLVLWAPNTTPAGAYTVTVRVTDQAGGFVTQTFTLLVLANNYPPEVEAGASLPITMPATASLNGLAYDDGNPPGSVLSYAWSQVSGPGVATFADSSAAVTTSSFSDPGNYVLRLTASDGQLSDSDDISITVDPASMTTTTPTTTSSQTPSPTPTPISTTT